MTGSIQHIRNIVVLAGSIFAFATQFSQAEAATLRSSVSVSGDTVTLGDLFDDAGPASTLPVAAAPAPGARSAISVSRISQIARRNGVAWRNSQGLTRVVISRLGEPIPADVIEDALSEAIANASPSLTRQGQIQVALSSSVAPLMVTADEPQTLYVEQLRHDIRSGRFQAIVQVPAHSDNARRFRVGGRAFPALEIPVLNRRLSAGDEIQADDIDWIRLPTSRISQNTISDAGNLVGLTPKRGLRPGEPIRTNDVEPAQIVTKNAFITVTYRFGNMVLTSRGRAQSSGALGDTIQVFNQRSHRVIEATITGPNEGIVNPLGPLQLAAAQ